MSERLRALFPLLLATVLAIALVAVAGCSGQGGQSQQEGQQQQTENQSLKLDIVEQWVQSGHARPITFAAQEEGCKNCHDGQTFSETGGGFQPRRAAEGTGTGATQDSTGTESTGTAAGQQERDWVVATDCRVCHTAVGVEIAQDGSIDGVPSLDTAEGGKGALCMACHNGWHPAGASQGELNAPHYSVQTDILFGVNTMPVTGGGGATESEVESESPHAKVPDTCVGCHVTGGDSPNHRFAIEDFKGCQRQDCHKSDMTDGGEAKEDFDGDGNTETFKAEVEGLLETLSGEINRSAGSQSFASKSGQVVFEGAQVRAGDPAYAAAYNYLYVEKEGSGGIHNPEFTVKLLQDSIASLGGGTGGTGGSGETTGSETTTP